MIGLCSGECDLYWLILLDRGFKYEINWFVDKYLLFFIGLMMVICYNIF